VLIWPLAYALAVLVRDVIRAGPEGWRGFIWFTIDSLRLAMLALLLVLWVWSVVDARRRA
jgi:hypothetical protein